MAQQFRIEPNIVYDIGLAYNTVGTTRTPKTMQVKGTGILYVIYGDRAPTLPFIAETSGAMAVASPSIFTGDTTDGARFYVFTTSPYGLYISDPNNFGANNAPATPVGGAGGASGASGFFGAARSFVSSFFKGE